MKETTYSGISKPNRIFVAILILTGCLFIFSASTARAEDEAPSDNVALKWFRFHAERGDASSQNSLGLCYYGGEGVAKDDAKAIEWFRKAAEQGYSQAQHNLGVVYDNKKDTAEAMKWYSKAAEQGLVDAQCNLGHCYADMNNFAEAVKWFRLAADRGDDTAQCNLGVCYKNGTGVGCNPQEAFKLFRKAVERGNSMAEYNLGLCYINGTGIDQNEQEGLKYLNKAVEHGNEYAKNALKDLKAAKLEKVKLCRKAAEQSDVNAQYNLAIGYATENQLIGQNPKEALKWFRKAAEQGHLKSQLYLAFCYNQASSFLDRNSSVNWKAEGLNSAVFEVLRDAMSSAYERSSTGGGPAEARKWMRKAAEQGHKEAQYALGEYYASGNEQNIQEAMKWYLKAAEQGHREAQFTLGKYYQGGLDGVEGVEEDWSASAKWLLKAAEQGHGEAQDRISGCYLRGEGVTQNLAEAKKWNRKAMENNATTMSIEDLNEAPPVTPPKPKVDKNPTDATAQYNLGLSYDTGKMAAKWFLKAAEQGHLDAQYRLALCYHNPDEDGITKPQEAVKWLRKAAEKGHVEAAYSLGVLYDNNKNITESVKWYTKAAELGHAEAAYNLGNYYSNYNAAKLGVKPNYAEALKWYRVADEKGHICNERIAYIQQLIAAQKK